MPEPVEAVKQAPRAAVGGVKKIGKSLTNRPKWQYALAVVVAGGVAFMVYRRRVQAEDALAGDETALETDAAGQLVEPYSPWVTPGPTQGAYYGSSDPYAAGSVASGGGAITIPELADLLSVLGISQGTANPAVPAPVPAPVVVQVPGPIGGGAETRPDPGIVNAPTTPQPAPPPPPRPAPPPPPAACPGSHPYANPSYKGPPWGCYRVVLGSRQKCPAGKVERWHYYYDGRKVMVGCS